MPKLKTHKGARARFHVSATGKVLRTKGLKSHFRRRKSARVKRLFDKKIGLDSPTFTRRVVRALGGVRNARG